MKILGIGGSNHDFSSALLQDGKLVCVIEDERLDRIKHSSSHWASRPCHNSAQYCLDATGFTIGDIDRIYSNCDLVHPLGKKSELSGAQHFPHHLCHAASSFYTSPFEESALLVVDGHGGELGRSRDQIDLETISIGKANASNFHIENHTAGARYLSSTSWRYFCSNSLGVFYKIVSEALGFGERGQGKVMGLASYGKPVFEKELRQFLEYDKNGESFLFDPYSGISDWLIDKIKIGNSSFKVRADIAYAAQSVFEDVILSLGRYAHKVSGQKNLSFGGGCALNGAANYRLECEGPFDNISIFPAAGDNGLAVGAACYGHFIETSTRPATPSLETYPLMAYQGRTYSNEEIEIELDQEPLHYSQCSDLSEEISDLLASDEIVLLFQGASEIGPRALGNRSILAPANSAAIRDRINLLIKKRESFRPLAPLVAESDADKYFKMISPSPFMLSIAGVKPEFSDQLQGVTHVDQTARVQTVSETSNPLIHNILRKYAKKTGRPKVLINTSFNQKGEPIVESPKDAVNAFLRFPLNTLFMGHFRVEKFGEWIVAGEAERHL